MIYIDSFTQLKKICGEFSTSRWLALDTEFFRETTYYPKFCLLQIADLDRVACIDPLSLDTLEPLQELLFTESITKVFHAARQDLEIFYQLFKAIPSPLFDTQIAAPLLGFSDQIGYAALVSGVMNVHLEKAHSRADWSRRPLSPEQLQYAFDDVLYLGQIYQKMRNQLHELGRLAWLQEDFEKLATTALYLNSPETAWQRIRGTIRLTASQLSVLQVLAEWREHTAQQQNKPRNWLLTNDVIIDLARLQPESIDTLKNFRGLSSRAQQNYGNQLCALIQKAKHNPPITNNTNKLPNKTPEQDALLDVLMAVVRLRAAENSLNPTVIASRKDLERLLFDSANAKILHGWRKHLIGDELLAIARGKRSLTIVDGFIHIDEHPAL